MSLEKAIQENTEAVLKLVELFSRYVPATNNAPAAEEPKAEKPARKAKATPAPAEEESAGDNGTGAVVVPFKAPAAEPAKPAAPTATLADLQRLGLQIQAAKAEKPEGMTRLKAVLADHGGGKLSTLPTDAYDTVFAAMEVIISELGL